MRIIRPLTTGCLLFLAAAAASADEWPIAFAKLAVPPTAYGGAERQGPRDCQPEPFDPASTKYQPAATASPASAVEASTPAKYQVEGADAGVTMTIDSWARQDDAKTTLQEPFALTKYMFGCAGVPSQVFEFKKSGKRHALYTHVTQAKFSPDLGRVVLYNYAKPHHGSWQELRRIVDIRSRRFTPLPVINETAYLADVTAENIVTYGLPAGKAAKQPNPRGIAAIWDAKGKLVRALSVPMQADGGDRELPAAFGLLPAEPFTLYYIARTGDNTCTLRLQDIQRAEGRRTIQLAVPGAATAPCAAGAQVQFDLAGLRLKGGTMKYRVPAEAKENSANGWGAWQTAQ